MAQDDGEKSAIERAAEKELEAYRREKQEERRRLAEPARTDRERDGPAKDHLDPERHARRPGRSGAPKGAEGQAERGAIDRTITDKDTSENR
jgi:hypothetical protein